MTYVNRDMRKEPVDFFVFNPIGNRTKQVTWDGKENINPSINNPLFQTDQDIGKLSGNLLRITHEEVATFNNEATLLAKNPQSLQDHLDARISAFFRQLVDIYGKPLVVEAGKVEDQLKSSKGLKWVSEDMQRGRLSFESAHYGTIPCLIAYPRAEYEAWQNNPANRKPDGHVFDKYSDTYHFNNACEGHLKIVNKADSLLDWQGGADVNIRPFALQLLNASAKSEIDPLSATRLFIAKLSMSIETLLASRTEPSLQFIFQTYRNHLNQVRAMIDASPHDFLTFLLGIEINENDPRVQKLRDVIYPTRFKTLQIGSDCQSQIAARIEIAKNRILGNQKKPLLFDKAFKACIILNAAGTSEKISKVLQRHFCMNISQAQQSWNASYLPAKSKCLSPMAAVEINALYADITKLLHNYSIDISLLRANLLRHLRRLHGLSQSAVSTRVNQLSPNIRLYQQQLSRFELGAKKIDEQLAGTFSQLFGVHRSVFITDLPLAIPG